MTGPMNPQQVACPEHEGIKMRVSELEGAVKQINTRLDEMNDKMNDKAVADARMEKTLDMVTQTLSAVQSDTRELRGDLLKLIAETFQKTRDDMSNFVKMAQKSDEKDREVGRKTGIDERMFYRKLIITCVSVLATIVLASFGIRSIIPIFVGP